MPMRFRLRPRWTIILLSLGILGLGWLYLNQEVSSLVTLDAQSGKVLWSASLDSVAPIRRIITHKGRVYTLAAYRKESCGNWCIYIPFLSPDPNLPGITKVTAFNSGSGKQLWQFETNNTNASDWAGIQVTEKSVLLKTDQLTALDLTSGQIQWSVSLPVNSHRFYEGEQSFNPNLVVSRDRVGLLRVLRTPDNVTPRPLVETWQKTTGKPDRAFKPTPSSEKLGGSSLAATNDTILLFLPEEPSAKISGYEPETGKLKFSITTVVSGGGSIQDFYRNLSFSGSTIYQYIYNGPKRGKSVISVEAYDANTGKLRWQVPISDSRCTSFRSVPGGVYLSCHSFSSSPASLKFLDEKTGKVRWMKRFPEGTWLGLAYTGTSYTSLDGYDMTSNAIAAHVHSKVVGAEGVSIRLTVFSKTDGRELWSDYLDRASLYGADDNLVFLSSTAPRLSNLGIRF
jgi:outer membrane protein assembly factor BamB